MSRPFPIIKFVFFSVMLFWGNSTLAQTEEILLPQLERVQFESNILNISTNAQTVPFNEVEFISKDTRIWELQQFKLENGETALFEKMKFEQKRIDVQLPNMGESHHYKNTFVYAPDDKLSFSLGAGLLQQNTLMSGYQAIYRYTFNSSVEYEITSWLSAYFYGQYVSTPVNTPAEFHDPLQYMNPFFSQTETGGGLKAKYKKIQAGVGMRAIYDTQFNVSNPVKYLDTKISVGF